MNDGIDNEARRAALKSRVDAIDDALPHDAAGRAAFFNTVYETAGGDLGNVPWADQKPKDRLEAWLSAHPGAGRRGLDIACGVGDNAEAISAAGYATTAFDLAEDAVAWAKRRFPDSAVDYRVANLLDPPAGWHRAFDVVHECYTIQSVPRAMHIAFAEAVANFVAPGGSLLIYARYNPPGPLLGGAPWPLTDETLASFASFGLVREHEDTFDLERPDRIIPHRFAIWRRPE